MKKWAWLLFLLVGCSKPAPEPTKPLGQSAHIDKATSQAECRFSCELWRELPDKTQNLALSPPGLVYGLHLLASGAKGQTRSEIEKALHASSPTLADEYRKFFEDMAPVMKWAQRAYVKPGVPIVEDFVKSCEQHYATEVLPLPDKASIDQWVSESTAGRIPTLAIKDLHDVSLLLVNCLYLKVDWREPFEVKDTRPETFHGSAGAGDVPTMHQDGKMLYAAGPGYQVVELPYQEDRLVFDCILPDRTDGLAKLEEDLRWEKLDETLAKLERTPVNLSLPRFQVQAEIPATTALQQLGVRQAFQPDAAQFPGISTQPLSLSGVSQQTWLKVDEQGTEAAAVTEISVSATATPEPPRDFRVDHPFLFLIRDRTTGLILFMGRVVDPEKPA